MKLLDFQKISSSVANTIINKRCFALAKPLCFPTSYGWHKLLPQSFVIYSAAASDFVNQLTQAFSAGKSLLANWPYISYQ